jgi:hypothetical protein
VNFCRVRVCGCERTVKFTEVSLSKCRTLHLGWKAMGKISGASVLMCDPLHSECKAPRFECGAWLIHSGASHRGGGAIGFPSERCLKWRCLRLHRGTECVDGGHPLEFQRASFYLNLPSHPDRGERVTATPGGVVGPILIPTRRFQCRMNFQEAWTDATLTCNFIVKRAGPKSTCCLMRCQSTFPAWRFAHRDILRTHHRCRSRFPCLHFMGSRYLPNPFPFFHLYERRC